LNVYKYYITQHGEKWLICLASCTDSIKPGYMTPILDSRPNSYFTVKLQSFQ